MKYCPYCGNALINGTLRFCTECGKELPSAEERKLKPTSEPKQANSGRKKEVQITAGTRKESRRQEKSEFWKKSSWDRKKIMTAERKADSESVSQQEQLEAILGAESRRFHTVFPKKRGNTLGEPDLAGEEPSRRYQNENYDGYYDDVLPEDEGRYSEGIDRGLVKKIVLIIGMVLLIVGACVMMMYLL